MKVADVKGALVGASEHPVGVLIVRRSAFCESPRAHPPARRFSREEDLEEAVNKTLPLRGMEGDEVKR